MIILKLSEKAECSTSLQLCKKKSVSHVNTILQNGKHYLSNIWLRTH